MSMLNTVTFEDGIYRFKCPNCLGLVEVLPREVRCKIFRHAIFKDNGQQIGPHTSKQECDKLVREGKVRGCAKPFQMEQVNNETWIVKKCDYI